LTTDDYAATAGDDLANRQSAIVNHQSQWRARQDSCVFAERIVFRGTI